MESVFELPKYRENWRSGGWMYGSRGHSPQGEADKLPTNGRKTWYANYFSAVCVVAGTGFLCSSGCDDWHLPPIPHPPD